MAPNCEYSGHLHFLWITLSFKDEIDNESDTFEDFDDDDDKMPDSESEFESDPEEDKFDIGKSKF